MSSHPNSDHKKPISVNDRLMKDILNVENDTSSTTSQLDVEGGISEIWKPILEVGRKYVNHLFPKDGKDMVTLDDLKQQIDRCNFPLHFNPQTASFNDIGLHGLLRQRLKDTTVEKHLRYARFMETHIVPVNFRNPSFSNFMHHMDYREQVERATPNALIHQWKAMQMFLKAYGIPFGQGTGWEYNPPSAQRARRRILPLPETVNQFFTYIFSDDEYETALYQYMFFHSYLIGWRIPSEIITMKTTDLKLDAQIPHIIITEPKKNYNTRTLFDVERAVLTSRVHKSFKNWIDHWRPKVANQYSGDALYLWPSGNPVTTRTLGHMLSAQGKKIWPEYRPYDMRHWCAVARLIKSKVETGTFDVFEVQKLLGHEEITTTNTYISQAVSYYKHLPVDWISLALKPCQKSAEMAGKRDKEKTNRMHFLGLLPEFSPREVNGPVAI